MCDTPCRAKENFEDDSISLDIFDTFMSVFIIFLVDNTLT